MKNKVAVVTGGAGHIGKETCIKLAQEGCHIVIIDKDENNANNLVTYLNDEYGTDNLTLSIDLMEPSSFKEVFNKVNNKYEKLDYLVNSAAFYDDTPGWGVDFEEESYEAWMKVLRVNTLAPFFLSQSLYPLLKESDSASIVNLSSIYGVVAPDHSLYDGTDMKNPAVYGVSKSGLQQVTRWLCTVLAPTVRVNTVTPGGVERGQTQLFINRYNKKTPLNRMATEEDIADSIIYLLSDKSKYITGHNLLVDGGWTIW